MSTELGDLLESYRDAAKTEREKGTYFENLSLAYLENDPEMTDSITTARSSPRADAPDY